MYVCLQTKHAAGGAEHVHCKLQYFLYYLNRVIIIIIIFTTTIQLCRYEYDRWCIWAFALQIYFKNVNMYE